MPKFGDVGYVKSIYEKCETYLKERTQSIEEVKYSMKGKFKAIWRVSLALMLALSLGLVMVAPAAAQERK